MVFEQSGIIGAQVSPPLSPAQDRIVLFVDICLMVMHSLCKVMSSFISLNGEEKQPHYESRSRGKSDI